MKIIKKLSKYLLLTLLITNLLFLTSCNSDNNEVKETIDLFPGSTLLNSQQKTELAIMYGDENQIWKKAYKGTDDGFTALAFHTNCDNKGRSMTLIKLDNGFILGGYNSKSWDSGLGAYIESTDNFLFSITNNKKYMILDDQTSIACYNNSSFGPAFGGGSDLQINFNNSYCNPASYNYNGLNKAESILEFTGVENDGLYVIINIIDIEVWVIN